MTLIFDKPKKKPVCGNCGKRQDDHHGRTMACPIGSKHRVVGYTQFSGVSFFDAKQLPQGERP